MRLKHEVIVAKNGKIHVSLEDLSSKWPPATSSFTATKFNRHSLAVDYSNSRRWKQQLRNSGDLSPFPLPHPLSLFSFTHAPHTLAHMFSCTYAHTHTLTLPHLLTLSPWMWFSSPSSPHLKALTNETVVRQRSEWCRVTLYVILQSSS